jgi:hypothetical protein
MNVSFGGFPIKDQQVKVPAVCRTRWHAGCFGCTLSTVSCMQEHNCRTVMHAGAHFFAGYPACRRTASCRRHTCRRPASLVSCMQPHSLMLAACIHSHYLNPSCMCRRAHAGPRVPLALRLRQGEHQVHQGRPGGPRRHQGRLQLDARVAQVRQLLLHRHQGAARQRASRAGDRRRAVPGRGLPVRCACSGPRRVFESLQMLELCTSCSGSIISPA